MEWLCTHVQREAVCGDEMMPLGNDFGKMKSLIAGLATSGETYLPSGLLWGWRALTPVAPFTEAASSPDNTTSIMIFMTDGFNTLSQDDEYHDGHHLLKQCASDLSKNFEARDAAQLTGAFKEIVGRLGSVRLKYRPT